ncbi:YitT family protein [Bosea thiooxidans]
MSHTASAPTPHKHRLYEDLLALPLGTLMISIGIVLFAKATVLTGGVAGLALLLQFATSADFSILFFVINLPFYWLAVIRMGWAFTLRTVAAVALISLFVWATPAWLRIETIAPLYAACAGGAAMGLGLLALARHRTAIGGVNILALYLQERHGVRAGWVQLGIDAAIFAAALFVLPLDKVAMSLVGTVVINAILAMNHKPGRYMAIS